MIHTLPSSTLIGEACREQLSPAAFAAALVRFEVALARAQAVVGLIPHAAAVAIERAASDFVPDAAALAAAGHAAGTPVVALLQQLRARLRTASPEASGFLHFGATSQDAIDTAAVLCLAPCVTRACDALERARNAAFSLAERHAETPMLARTLLQAAAVTTFGFKAALWGTALGRTVRRVRQAGGQALAVQLGGPVGDGAAFGDRWDRLRVELAGALGLAVPPATWHATRDEWIDLLGQLALSTGVAAKVAGDVALMAQSEVGEVHEPSMAQGVSSAMPHKQNPVLCMRIRACAYAAAGLAAGLMSTIPVEHERGLGTWQAELALAPSLAATAVSAAESLAELLAGLRVDAGRARRNIEATGGLVFADRAAARLSAVLPAAEASRLVEEACREARDRDLPLRDLMASAWRRRPEGDEPPAEQVSAALDRAFDLQDAAGASARAARALIEQARAGTGEQVR